MALLQGIYFVELASFINLFISTFIHFLSIKVYTSSSHSMHISLLEHFLQPSIEFSQ